MAHIDDARAFYDAICIDGPAVNHCICSREIPDEDEFCDRCAALAGLSRCPHCNHHYDAADECGECGYIREGACRVCVRNDAVADGICKECAYEAMRSVECAA